MDYISASPYGDIAQAIQADLAAIGIKVQLLPGEQKQVITKTRARQHQLAMLVWGTDYFDPNSNAQAWCENPDDGDQSKLKILAWRSHFVDKELMGESQAAVHELDPAKRIALYKTMQKQFMERAPFAMLLQTQCGRGAGQGRVGTSRSGRCPTTRTTRRSGRRERAAADAGGQLRQHSADLVRVDAGHVPDRPGDADRSGDRHRRRSRPARRDRGGARSDWASTSRCSCSSGSIW